MGIDIFRLELIGSTADVENAGADRDLLLRISVKTSNGRRPYYDWLIKDMPLERGKIFTRATKISIESVESVAGVCLQLVNPQDKPKTAWLPSKLSLNVYWGDGEIQELFNYQDWSGWFSEETPAHRTHELFPERSDQDDSFCEGFSEIEGFLDENIVETKLSAPENPNKKVSPPNNSGRLFN